MVSKRKQCLPLLLLGVFASTLAAQSANLTPTPESWKETPKAISEVDVTGYRDPVREERSSHFNAKTPNAQKLDSLGSTGKVREGHFSPQFVRLPAIPVQESDAAIIGTVLSLQPYFSTDRRHIYTEFTIALDEAIKDTTGHHPPRTTVPVVVQGGSIRLSDGRIVQEKVVKTNFAIAIGGRYVFFLHYVPKGQYFTVIKSWELKNGFAIPTALDDRLDAQQGRSRFAGVAMEGFVRAVKQAENSNQDKE